LCRFPDITLRALHSGEQLVGRSVVTKLHGYQQFYMTQGGARLTETESSDRGFAETRDYVSRASSNVGAAAR